MVGSVVAAGVLGLVFGSFLNVVIYRVPRGISIVRPGSSCPRCGTDILAYDNVPVVSYLLLKGHCRACGASISARYPLVELATASLFAAAVLRASTLERAGFLAASSTVLLALALIDVEFRRVPNVIVVPATGAMIVWVFVSALVDRRWTELASALGAGAAAFALFLMIALVSGGMGMGDVKLAAFVGVVTGRLGWEATVLAVFVAFVAGGLVSLVLLVSGRRGRRDALPFAPALALGGIVGLFAGTDPVRAWLGL